MSLVLEGGVFRSLLVLPLVAGLSRTAAAGDPAVSRLNAELVPLYRQLMAGQHADLPGRQLSLKLRLKHASERFLLFADTQVVVNDNTSYYLVKWQYEVEDIAGLIGKTGVVCQLSGTIVEVIANANSPPMPYLLVRLQSVSL